MPMGERWLEVLTKKNGQRHLNSQQQPTGLQGSGALGKGVISQCLLDLGAPILKTSCI